MKPKTNYTNIPKRDMAQTPPYALGPLLPYIPTNSPVWEPACGEGYLSEALMSNGFTVIKSDILHGIDFLNPSQELATRWYILITNPPYSIKYKWLQRCYELGKPFALLMPLETLGAAKAQKLFKQHGMELIVLNKRVNFKMPDTGWNGGGAQFPTAWFTYGLNIGRDITYAEINNTLRP